MLSYNLLIMVISYYGTKNTCHFSGPPPPINLLTYYLFCFILPLTIFSIFSFSPPKSNFRKLILVSSLLSTFSFPLIFSNIYTIAFHVPNALISFNCCCKMIIWLKNSLKDPNSTNPFVWSLFHWRPKEGRIPTLKKQDLLEQGISGDHLKSLINYHHKKCLCSLIFYISLSQFTELFTPDVPDTPYPIRFINFFYDGTPFISIFNIFYCYIYAGALYYSMIYLYEIIIISSAYLLSYIYSTPNSLLQTMLTENQLNSLKLWLISFLLYSKPIFNHPYFSKNPKELWSDRWHQMLGEFFTELGYKPTCYLFSFTSIKIQKIFGTLAAFAVSGILHEYILYSSNRYLTLEQLTFFLFNGIIMIIWEFFTNPNGRRKDQDQDQDQESFWEKFRNSLVMTIFVLLSMPWFIEPYIRCEHHHTMMHIIRRFK